jgi:hypothetical protein
MRSATGFENASAGGFDFAMLIDPRTKMRRKKRADLGSALIDLDADG